MDRGSIGEYAQNKITETIQWINNLNEHKVKLEEFDIKKQLTVGEELEKTKIIDSINSLLLSKIYHKELIEIIDEPIIKNKLLEIYSEIFGNDERKKYLLAEKERIEKEIEQLNSK